MVAAIKIENIKSLFSNEWVLLGNPITDNNLIDVLEGVSICHNKDKKEVCYIGRDKTDEYE